MSIQLIKKAIIYRISWSPFILIIGSFFFFWLRWGFVAACGLSLVAAGRGYSSLWCAGFSLRWLLLFWSTGSSRAGFSSCGTWASVVVARRLSSCSARALVSPRHVGSSQTRAWTRVPCIGRWILNHCTTREALIIGF